MPARSCSATLDATRRSLDRQTLRDWECVLVVAGDSIDSTLERARAWADADPRVRLTVHGAGPGLVPALNLGLAECRAPLVARMDADDIAHSRRLAEQAALLDARPDLAGVGCHVRLFPRRGLSAGQLRYEAWLDAIDGEEAVARERFVECPLAHPSLMMRTEVLRAFGYRDRGWPEDYDLLLRLCAAGHRLGVLPARRLLWRDHPARTSRTDSAYALDRFCACKAEFLARGFLAGVPDYILWGYGNTGRRLRRALAAHGLEPSHVVELHPRRLGQRIAGAPVIPPAELARIRPARIVVSVAGAENRALIRAQLAGLGLRELEDFVCAA